MKKFLKISGVLLLLIIVLAYLFREPLKQELFAMVTKDMFVPADNDNYDPGPDVDAPFPSIHALYQNQIVSTIGSFAGPNGTVVIASRSVDWCPYCMRQMVQLQQYKSAFDAAGIGMVGITYDSPELQQPFIDKHGIEFPLLSDIDTRTFTTLDILNEDYVPGDHGYGIPHPGLFVIDSRGFVAGKLFIESYATRVDSGAALAFARSVLAIPSADPR
jgi:peroxiredoxin